LGLGRYEEALEIYEDCIRNYPYIDHSDLKFHNRKGKALFGLERYEEALVAYNEAIRLSSDEVDPEFYEDKGVAHERLAKIAFGMAEKRHRKELFGNGKLISSFSLMPTELLTEIRTLSGHTRNVNSVVISSDGQIAVSGGDDKTVKIWDLQSGQELRTLSGHTDVTWGIAISSDGQTLVSGSEDTTIKIWNLQNGQELRTLGGHTGTVIGVAISADGQIVMSGSYDGTIKVWGVR
jgi:tetratricopeptide (TPR) repeat protein